MTAQILRLRCVRCGDWHEREVGDPYLPELCGACFSKYLAVGGRHKDYAGALGRFVDRYSRDTGRHPTVLALKAAWAEHTKDWPKNTSGAPF